MIDNFETCLDRTLAHEGGYVDNPNDPGGETNMGISKRSYPNEDIRNMTRDRAAFLYRRDYWEAVRGDELPSGVDMVVFDAAVNSGPRQAIKWLQRAVGAAPDGIVGVRTMAAVANADPLHVVRLVCTHRLSALRALSTWTHFGKGWERRVENVKGVALALATATEPPLIPTDLRLAALESQITTLEGQIETLQSRLAAVEDDLPGPPNLPNPPNP